ncbi:hypothetical protein [Pseudonocardia sp. GCM10023141]|uniref:hypothetical protein n=1 Tax=Pseudonocardia sp. GCM10023141 TaxID=3252653 RepID=UPI003606AC65
MSETLVLSDNTAGTSPESLHAIVEAASGSAPPYGAVTISARARDRFAEVFERPISAFPDSTGSAAKALLAATEGDDEAAVHDADEERIHRAG